MGAYSASVTCPSCSVTLDNKDTKTLDGKDFYKIQFKCKCGCIFEIRKYGGWELLKRGNDD